LRFLEALYVLGGKATWSQLKRSRSIHFSQDFIAVEEKRLEPKDLITITREGKKKIFGINAQGKAVLFRLNVPKSPESWQSLGFDIHEGEKRRVKVRIDAYSDTLQSVKAIRDFYVRAFTWKIPHEALNFLHKLRMLDEKQVLEGPVKVFLAIRADFSNPPRAPGRRGFHSLTTIEFPPQEAVRKWIDRYCSLLTLSRNIQEVVEKFEQTAVKSKLSDQVLLLAFAKFMAFSQAEFNPRRLRLKLKEMQKREPDAEEVLAWRVFFDEVLGECYERLKLELTPEGFSQETFRIIQAYQQATREFQHNTKDAKTILQMLNRWKEIVLQTIPPS